MDLPLPWSISYKSILFSIVEAPTPFFSLEPKINNGNQELLVSPSFFHHGHGHPKIWHKEVSRKAQRLCSWQYFFITPLLCCCNRQQEGMHIHME
jgi:hypothetical protein